jgi:elongation factor 1-beta
MKLKVMPSDVDVDLGGLKSKIQDKAGSRVEVKGFDIQPIAFGLKALLVLAVIPDDAGDEFIEEIQQIDGVGNVEVESMELL